MRSTATAVASPPPMHSEATPLVSPYFSSAASKVTRMRAPEAPIGMAERAGAAVHVDLVVRQPQVAHGAQRDHRERLVDLIEADVARVPADLG